jgi:hypothetical protein
MSRLNKAQVYAINWLHSQDKSLEDIANELDLNIEQVTKSIEKTSSNNKKNIKTGSEPAVQKQADLMITKTSGKNNSGVTIMTREASEKNDSIRGKLTNQQIRTNAIHRPKSQ